MEHHYQDDDCTIYNGDCLELMPQLTAGSVDSIVTDPPYGLKFMGKGWDHGVPGAPYWQEALRVAKPGAHLLAFGGTRTYHRLAVAIEDAGWEIRDCIMWVYGSGFPKSLDVSKAIDKAAGVEGEFGGPKSAAHAGWIDRGRMRGDSGHEGHQRPWMNDSAAVDKNARQYIPATDDALQWGGWGTAIKPSYEPILVARKPLIGTVAANVLKHGTGAINVDGCRVHSDDSAGYAYTAQRMTPGADQNKTGKTHQDGVTFEGQTKDGRWPANLIHDGSEEVTGLFPHQTSGGTPAKRSSDKFRNSFGTFKGGEAESGIGSSKGSAARFYYCAKANKKERRNSKHPTIKPLALMRYLVRLVTPPVAVVLDPFMGSGTTLEAAWVEGMQAIGMDLSAEYCNDAAERIRERVKLLGKLR